MWHIPCVGECKKFFQYLFIDRSVKNYIFYFADYNRSTYVLIIYIIFFLFVKTLRFTTGVEENPQKDVVQIDEQHLFIFLKACKENIKKFCAMNLG